MSLVVLYDGNRYTQKDMLENAQNNNHQNNQPTTLIIECTKNELTTIIYNCAVAFVATGKGYFYWGTFFNLWHCDQISNVKYLLGSMHWYFYLESLDQSSQIQWLKTASEAAASSYSQEEGLKFIDYYRTVGLGQQEIVDQENESSKEHHPTLPLPLQKHPPPTWFFLFVALHTIIFTVQNIFI